MATQTNLLTDKACINAGPGRHYDGDNLYLNVSPTGVKRWLRRGRLNNKEVPVSLGKYPAVSLKDARKRNVEAYLKEEAGIDPRVEAAVADGVITSSPTFGELVLKRHAELLPTFKKPVYGVKWLQRAEKHTKKIWDVQVHTITVAKIEDDVLKPIWQELPAAARALRSLLNDIFDRAAIRGQIAKGTNPARDAAKLMVKQVKKGRNQPAMHYRDLPAYFAYLAQSNRIGSQALMLTILSCLRTSEVLGMKDGEFGVDQYDNTEVWTVPAIRLKTSDACSALDNGHKVPMTQAFKDVLARIKRSAFAGDLVLSSPSQPGSELNLDCMLSVLQKTHPDLTVHGFRATFRSWAMDHEADLNQATVEFCLTHIEGSAAAQAYMRSDMLAKRRRIMQMWADHCTSAMPKQLPAPVLALPAPLAIAA